MFKVKCNIIWTLKDLSLRWGYSWRAESITAPCRIFARFSILLGFVRFFAFPGLENISRFYNRGQKSLRKPNTNSTKTTCLLFLLLILPQNYTSLSHPLPLCNDNRTQTAKKPLTYCFSLNSAAVTSVSPPPLPLMQCWCGKWCLPGNCLWPRKQHWVGGGGGGGGGRGECDGLLVYQWKRLEG